MRRRFLLVLPDFRGGGAQRAAINFAARLDPGRYVPSLLVLDPTGPLRDLVPAGMELHSLRTARLRQALPRLLAALRRLRPDVIFSTFGHINLAVLALRPLLAPRPFVVIREPNTPSASLPRQAGRRLLVCGYRWLYPRADLVVCQSELMARELRERFGIAVDRSPVLANPVDVDEVRRCAMVPRRQTGPGVRFVAAGRLTEQKGYDELFGLLARSHASGHLTLFGEGSLRPQLEAQVDAAGLGDRVRFAGFEAAPWPWYAGADAMLLPSRWEGMPNAALEALACGTPVIATPSTGGLVEVACEASPGAVVIAAMGDGFLAAMCAVRPVPTSAPRDNLLPGRFEAATASAAFQTLVDGLFA